MLQAAGRKTAKSRGSRKLAELGLIGALLLAAFLGGCGGSKAELGAAPTNTADSTAVPGEAGGGSQLSIDLGEPALPITVEHMTVAKSVKAFEAPESLPLYAKKVERPLTQENMEWLASTLGLTGVTWEAGGFRNSEYVVEFPAGDEATCFTLTKTEWMKAYTELIEQGQGEQIPALPADEEVQKVADDYLARLGLDTGLKRNAVFAQDTVETPGEEGLTKSYELSKAASYQASIGDLALLGPGAKVYVTLGPGGQLVRFVHWPMPTLPGNEVKLRAVDRALEDVKAGKGVPPSYITPETAKEISVIGVSLAYWAELLPMQEKYYKPVYVFSVVDAAGHAGSWVVPALEATEG